MDFEHHAREGQRHAPCYTSRRMSSWGEECLGDKTTLGYVAECAPPLPGSPAPLWQAKTGRSRWFLGSLSCNTRKLMIIECPSHFHYVYREFQNKGS